MGESQQVMSEPVPSLHWTIPYCYASETVGISALSILKSFSLHSFTCEDALIHACKALCVLKKYNKRFNLMLFFFPVYICFETVNTIS